MRPANEEDEFRRDDESVLDLRGSLIVGAIAAVGSELRGAPGCIGTRMAEGGRALNPLVDGGGLESREVEGLALWLAELDIDRRSIEASEVLLERELG